MPGRLLDICGPLTLENSSPLAATARVNFGAFAGWSEVDGACLAIEALNQFAARFARELLVAAGKRPWRVLPARVARLTQHAELRGGPYVVSGTAARSGHAVKVSARLGPCPGPPEPLVTAELMAAGLVSNHAATAGPASPPAVAPADRPWDPGSDPLFEEANGSRGPRSVSFRVRGDCALLAEHFPGLPVAPGSLLLALIRTAISRMPSATPGLLQLEDVRFETPVAPGRLYTLHLRPLTQPGPGHGYTFAVIDEAEKVRASGAMRFLPQPGLAP